MPTFYLDKPQTILLLQKYQDNDVLWNPRHPKHRDVELKRKVWEQIADDFFTSTLEIKKKIKSLTAKYHLERKKIQDGELYQPTLYYYYAFENIKRHLLEKRYPATEDTCSINLSPKKSGDATIKKAKTPPNAAKGKKTARPLSPKSKSPNSASSSNKNESPIPTTSSTTGLASKLADDCKSGLAKPAEALSPGDINDTDSECAAPLMSMTPKKNETLNVDHGSLSTLERVNCKLQDIIHETTLARKKSDLGDTASIDSGSIKVIMPSKTLRTGPSGTMPSLNVKAPSAKISSYRSQKKPAPPLSSQTRELSNLTGYRSSTSSVNEEDIFSCMAKVWADKLSVLQASQRLLAEKAINEIMFQAELGSLDLELIKTISNTTLQNTNQSAAQKN